jgi:adenylate cyclase
VIVYQLLTGNLPIDDPIPARLIMRKVEEAPADPRDYNPGIPEWLAHGLLGLLDPEAKLRMKSLPQFVKNLEMYAPQLEQASILTNIAGNTLSLDDIIRDTPLRERVMRRVTHATTASLVIFSALVGLSMFLFTRTEFNSQLDYAILDHLFQSRGPRQPDEKVMIIGMDERSYEALSVPITAPWPRALHAKLLNRLADDGAERVVMDIVFFDTSSDPQQDLTLAQAISRVPTILGAASGFAQHATINGSFLLEELVSPIDLLTERAKAVGIVSLPTSLGRIRGFLVERSELFPDVPSLAESASGIAPGTGPDTRALMNFYGPARTVPTVSYEMAVSDEHPLPKGTFAGKVVFVGLNLRGRTGPSQREAFATPFDESTFGTELHATATSNLLKRDWIDRLSPGAEAIAVVTVAVLCALPVLMLGGLTAGVVFAFIGIILVMWQYILFAAGWFVPLGGAVIFGPLAALLIRVMSNQRLPVGRRRRLIG